MIKCIIHMADVHIRPYKRLKEYTQSLTRVIKEIDKVASNYERREVRIVIAGDLTHNKYDISNELIAFTSTWIRDLEQIAEVIVISGNHDVNINNEARMDTLTALFSAALFPNSVHFDSYLKYDSGIVVDDNVTWALYSIFSNFRKPDIEQAKKENPDNIVLGLFHGPIVGAKLNNGTLIDSGIDKDLFEGCDFVLAGDIHKRQVIRQGETEIVYPGSLIQQDFGETVSEHGFAVWDLENRSYSFVDVENDYPMYSIGIESMNDIENDKETLLNWK